jgi:molybdenum cofactor cytidylyltransferase
MTVALLPPNTPVVPRQMVATVKIIPFAAPRTALETVLARQAAHGPLVRVARFAPMRAVLVQTRLPGTRPSVLAHTVDVTRARLAGVGGELISDSVVEHDAVRVADALTTGIARGADLLLILGASAVVDRRDVIPSAIGAAGGVVEHFGMPVDPGNLLLLGKLGGKPVIGLPGCARSPRLNGFDWVLQRVAAGVPIGRAEIMRMGAGGLLAEIPSRPLPRRTASPAPPALRQARIASLILAAGRPRIPARANDRRRQADAVPRVVRAVETATRSQGIATIVVVGHDADRIGQALTGSEARIVHNPDFEHGLSSSLRVGLSALPAEIDGVLVQLGDMPRVTTAHLDRLIAAFDPAEGRAICIPTHRARRGNPVLWATRFVPEMLALTGDQGARGLLGLHADQICEVEMDDDGILLDGDTSANPLDGGEPSA